MKLCDKLRTYKFENNLKHAEIARDLGVSAQSIRNWCGRGRSNVNKVKKEHACLLVEYTDNYITMVDCGYGTEEG